MDAQMVSPGFGAMLAQLGPKMEGILHRIQPLLDQPVIRFPYSMALSQGQVIDPGATNVVLLPTDFQYSFEDPFEVHEVSLSQDVAHTLRDWRISLQDQSFNKPMQKSNSGTLAANLVDLNTGKYAWRFPWVVRPKGGAYSVVVTNLDTVNPITVDISFNGYQLIPR